MASHLKKIGTASSDLVLIVRTGHGDLEAYAELWRRHNTAAITVARLYTTSLDAEDLVSEAYLQILTAIRRGRGPSHGAFRPYLYTVVRNLAHRWGSARHEITVDDFPDVADMNDSLASQLDSLNNGMARDAFLGLPRRWQEVLWYTEVERMTPAEVAPLLGVTANSVAALAYRAREGLRQRWLQAHVADAQRSGECAWALEHVGEHSRDGLSSRNRARMEHHLHSCASCDIVALEVSHVSDQLAGILAPITLGGGVAGLWMASLGHGAGAAAAPVTAASVGVTSIGGGLATGMALGAGATGVVTVIGLVGGLVLGSPVIPDDTANSRTDPISALSHSGPTDEIGSPEGPRPDGVGGFDAPVAVLGPPPDIGDIGDISDVVVDITDDVSDILNKTTETVGDLVGDLTGGVVTSKVTVDLDPKAPKVHTTVGVGDTTVGADVKVGGDSVLDTTVDVGGILGLTVKIGGGGSLGIGLFGSSKK